MKQPAHNLRVAFSLVTTVLLLCCSGTEEKSPAEHARTIHEHALVIDAHAHPKPHAAETLNLAEKKDGFEVDFLTMNEGGLDAIFFALPFPRSEASGLKDWEQILEDAEVLAVEVERWGDLAEMAYSPEDVSRIHEIGKRAVLLGIEAADPLGGDIGHLEKFHRAGVRTITLSPKSLTATNALLNDLGRGVIEEMNRLGLIVDITHVDDSLQLDIIRTSSKPVVASHSCARALSDGPRQIPDSIIRALAETGGVMSVTFYPGHISSAYPEDTVTIEDLVNHIDHIVQIAGVDHVGFGSDFIGGDHYTVGLESAAALPGITRELLERGYSQGDIEKILGGNLLRVFESVVS